MSEQTSASNGTKQVAAPDDPAVIEAQIEATRARLAGTVDELAVRLRPEEIGRRTAEEVKARVRAATTTPDGSPRVERLAAVTAAVVALIAMSLWRKRRR